ncbi:MAG: rRNA small subunit methyltransferase B [Rhodoluna sp.]|nr:rRNA small subunit methyltransferase B [Rhodoluna sp.]
MKTSREVAFELLGRVRSSDAYANLLLPDLIGKYKLNRADAAMCVELAFGTLRNQGFYDYVAAKVTARAVEAIDADALDVIRLGAHQILGMRTPPHAALNETVNLAKRELRQGAVGFVNAALRRISEKPREEWVRLLERDITDPNRRLSVLYSHPEWIVKALKLALEADGRNEIEKLLRANNDAPTVNLVALPNQPFEQDEDLVREGVSPIGYRLEGGDPTHLRGFQAGSLRVQDQGSQLAALALSRAIEAKAGEKWLDLCAGPGGKAALLGAEAELAGATLVANEISNHRARLVSQALADSKVKARVVNEDGRTLDIGTFDRIMIDAPCTGLGALRRRPESRWRKSPDDLKELTTLQADLLESGWRQLKPGGYLAYVTCSPHPAETTAVVSKHLSKHKNAELIDAGEILERVSDEFIPNRSRKTVQLWPHTNDTDAMFISIIRKVG